MHIKCNYCNNIKIIIKQNSSKATIIKLISYSEKVVLNNFDQIYVYDSKVLSSFR